MMLCLPGSSALEPNRSPFSPHSSLTVAHPRIILFFHRIPEQKSQAQAGVAVLRHIPPQGRACLERSKKDEGIITAILSSTSTVPKSWAHTSARSTDGRFAIQEFSKTLQAYLNPLYPQTGYSQLCAVLSSASTQLPPILESIQVRTLIAQPFPFILGFTTSWLNSSTAGSTRPWESHVHYRKPRRRCALEKNLESSMTVTASLVIPYPSEAS